MSGHAPAAPAQTAPAEAKLATSSRVAMTIIGIIILLVALWAVSNWNSNIPLVYDLKEVGYGETLPFEVPPGQTARLELTWKGIYPPMWSSEPIEVRDSSGRFLVLNGNKVVAGGSVPGEALTSFTFWNRNAIPVRIMVKHCNDTDPCPLTFRPPATRLRTPKVVENSQGGIVNNAVIFLVVVSLTILVSFVVHKLGKTVQESRISSYGSLVLGIVGVGIFGNRFLNLISGHDWASFYPLVFFVLCLYFVYGSIKDVPAKSSVGVYSSITKKRLYTNGEGLAVINPLTEYLSGTATDGHAVDLRKVKIEILDFDFSQTQTTGIQAKIGKISFNLGFAGDAGQLDELKDAVETIKAEVASFVRGYFRRGIAKLTPSQVDAEDGPQFQALVEGLAVKVNEYCKKQHFPYEIILDSVIVEDTELPESYYETLGERVRAKIRTEGVVEQANTLIPPQPNETPEQKTKRVRLALIEAGKLQGFDIEGGGSGIKLELEADKKKK
jgi:hypothetical protein